MRKISKAQLDELKRLARGPQNTYGSARTRVQNNLFLMRYAIFKADGKPCDEGWNADACEITEDGRAALKAHDELKDRARQKQRQRDEDARRLAAGVVTKEQLSKENAFFTLTDLKITNFGGSPRKR